MSKKGHTNNPHGRPTKDPKEKFETPKRPGWRVPEDIWNLWQAAWKKSGAKSLTEWAIKKLTEAAKRELKK